jgi:hypothetical protein
MPNALAASDLGYAILSPAMFGLATITTDWLSALASCVAALIGAITLLRDALYKKLALETLHGPLSTPRKVQRPVGASAAPFD